DGPRSAWQRRNEISRSSAGLRLRREQERHLASRTGISGVRSLPTIQPTLRPDHHLRIGVPQMLGFQVRLADALELLGAVHSPSRSPKSALGILAKLKIHLSVYA